MWDEDPDAPRGIEEVVAKGEQTRKILYNGQLYIIREGKIYNAVGTAVK